MTKNDGHGPSYGSNNILNKFYGISLVAFIAIIAIFVAKIPSIQALAISPLVIGIILGIFFANTVRVMILVLVTYHYGDEVGQGFIHDFAGLVLFGVALVLIIFVDTTIHWFERKYKAYNSKDSQS